MSNLHILSNPQEKFIIEGSDTFVAVIDGNAISSIEEFYKAVSHLLNFPDYFGENLDALDEMLYDLDWIENSSVLLIVKNSTQLLNNEKDKREAVISLIKEIDNPYFEVCFL